MEHYFEWHMAIRINCFIFVKYFNSALFINLIRILTFNNFGENGNTWPLICVGMLILTSIILIANLRLLLILSNFNFLIYGIVIIELLFYISNYLIVEKH